MDPGVIAAAGRQQRSVPASRARSSPARSLPIRCNWAAPSVARYNGFAKTGVDIDFGTGKTELNRFNGDPDHKPNPCIGPVATPPFYALAVWPAVIAVSTGLATDADARVLGSDGMPVPGLYACGNDMALVMAGSYPGPGTTLGPAIVFAYRATMHARGARRRRRRPNCSTNKASTA